MSGSQFLPPRIRTAGRVLAWAVAAAIGLCIFVAIWVTTTGVFAYQHLSRVQAGASETVAAVSKDPASAMSQLSSLADEASAARGLTSGPAWALASATPWVGPQVAAFRTVTLATDDLLTQSMLPLASAAESVSVEQLRPSGGRFDPTVLNGLVDPSRAAVIPARNAAEAVRDIDRTPLLSVVADAVDEADAVLTQSATFIDAISRTSQLLPRMLGQEQNRSYLILVENNAEWRSLGGISGSAILLRTENGAVSLVSTESATALSQNLSQPVVDLPNEITNVYGNRPARFFHNLTELPDFSVVGPLAKEFFAKKTGVSVDGVIAIDPVVLSYILSATGPVALPDGGKLSSENAVGLLMNEVYLRYPDPSQQDAIFATATGAVFQAILEGKGSPSGLISALGRAGNEHRLLMWNADPGEQSVLTGSTIAGPLPSTDDRTARFGLYLNDGTGSKMSYYLSPQASLGWSSCPSSDVSSQRQLSLHLDLVSSAPADAATTLPPYITGNGVYGTAPGSARIVGNIYLPEGFELVSARNSYGTSFTEASIDGRGVLTFGVDVAPQQSVSVDVVVTGASAARDAEAFVTPTASAALSPTVTTTCKSQSAASLE